MFSILFLPTIVRNFRKITNLTCECGRVRAKRPVPMCTQRGETTSRADRNCFLNLRENKNQTKILFAFSPKNTFKCTDRICFNYFRHTGSYYATSTMRRQCSAAKRAAAQQNARSVHNGAAKIKKYVQLGVLQR